MKFKELNAFLLYVVFCYFLQIFFTQERFCMKFSKKRLSKTKENSKPIPKYEVINLIENGIKGWLISVYTKEKTFYRIVSSFEQVVEKEGSNLYLCIATKGCKNIGFRFNSDSYFLKHKFEKKLGIFKIFIFDCSDQTE